MAVRRKVIENNALQRKLEGDLTQAFLAGKLDTNEHNVEVFKKASVQCPVNLLVVDGEVIGEVPA
jgi:hypothetical protein